jgi:methyltransferase (TIGR00027 family)
MAARQRAGRTASGASTIKAAEWYVSPELRLVDDPLAVAVLSAPLRWMVKCGPARRRFIAAVEREAPGTYGGLVCRARFIDDVIAREAAKGIDAVVIVGAGMDTRAYRKPLLQSLAVWEVDLPEVQSAKKRRLARLLGTLSPHVRFVPLQLERGSLAVDLLGAGFSASSRTVFVMEGVTQHLERAAIDDVFSVAARCASGSRIVFTYVPQAIVDGTWQPAGAAATRQRMRRGGHPWITGLEPETLEQWLRNRGLELIQHVV